MNGRPIADVERFARVRYREVYRRVAVVYDSAHQLEHDFEVRARPTQIRMHCDGGTCVDTTPIWYIMHGCRANPSRIK
jgi:hypothetical protein